MHFSTVRWASGLKPSRTSARNGLLPCSTAANARLLAGLRSQTIRKWQLAYVPVSQVGNHPERYRSESQQRRDGRSSNQPAQRRSASYPPRKSLEPDYARNLQEPRRSSPARNKRSEHAGRRRHRRNASAKVRIRDVTDHLIEVHHVEMQPFESSAESLPLIRYKENAA